MLKLLYNITRLPAFKKEFDGPVTLKQYPRFEQVALPKPYTLTSSLSKVFSSRESTRTFDTTKGISAKEIATLLYYGAGVKEKKGEFLRKFHPSGGKLYSLETYVIVRRAGKGIDTGVYHYNALTHSLESLPFSSPEDFDKVLFVKKDTQDAAIYILFTARWSKEMHKQYRQFGYRLILMEAGHSAQNVLLTASAQNLRVCPLGGFYGDTISTHLGIDHDEEDCIYALVIGKE